MLTGENGLLTKVEDAKVKNEEGEIKEEISLAWNSVQTDGIVNNLSLSDKAGLLKTELEKNGNTATVAVDGSSLNVTYRGYQATINTAGGGITSFAKETTPPPSAGVGVNKKAEKNDTVDGKTASYSNPIIPKGFKAIDVGEAKWGTETGYQYGLVIEDAQEGSETIGSQFVWVPVQEYNNFKLIEGFENTNLQTYVSGGSSKEAGSTSVAGSPISNNVAGTQESIKMYKSVKDNGGFYIARYEAGIAKVEGEAKENYSLATKTLTDGTVKPLSKEGLGVWNSIGWGGTAAAKANDGLQGNDNADGAVKVARSMYNDSEKYGATSTLCYGVQWDATMTFLDPNYSNGTYDASSYVKNSTGRGHYCYDSSWNKITENAAVTTTGSNSNYAVKNIFDLAGNVSEWTMEAYDTNNRVIRRRPLHLRWYLQSSFLSLPQ